jgi:hypothetical protein
MIPRRLLPTLTAALAEVPAVALLGPRQVGKTTLALEVAKTRPSVYLDLEAEADRAKLTDAERYLAQHEDKLVILDEIQRTPQLFQSLRGLIDAGRRRGRGKGRFLVLGSASIDLLRQSSESLAGRIRYLELNPLDAGEVGRTRRSRREPPKMTAGRAALVALMHRYLGGLLDPFVTLLEVHKLMYFLQEAGEPLRLRYKAAPYGPYAENLRHALHAIEGHLIAGYDDGGDAPDKPLTLVPSAVEEAAAFIAEHLETRERFERVSALVDGFESPFGLELLSTVHWVMRHEPVRTLPDVVARTYAWNDRKRRFTPRQIGIAADVLTRQGWTAPLTEEA